MRVEELYETDKYTVHTVPVNDGELIILLPKNHTKVRTVLILPESDCRNFILLAVLLVKNMFRVVLACPRVTGIDTRHIKLHNQIVVSEHENEIHVICNDSDHVVRWDMSLDNILKILNKVVECREREDTSLHRAK